MKKMWLIDVGGGLGPIVRGGCAVWLEKGVEGGVGLGLELGLGLGLRLGEVEEKWKVIGKREENTTKRENIVFLFI